jgi:uncharacterized protein (TIGR02001 family)
MTCGLVAAGCAVPASAQAAIEAALQTDYRVRGYSVSDGQPSASLSISYDHPSGGYAGGSVIGTVHHGEPAVVGVLGNAGYAARIGHELSLDLGVASTRYFKAYGTGADRGYTEIYLGLALPAVAARLSYSPDYYRSGAETLYAEVAGGIEPGSDWLLSAHAGVLSYLGDPPTHLPDRTFDWRVGASRQFGRCGVHLDLSGRIESGAHHALPAGVRPERRAQAVVLGLSRAF